ncbi:MAG: aldehyde dehydrogenase family protein [Candidatus Dormibacteraeota bacterium]|nr:aldehyde dehydrogenase family protein [Candidatus Dormibacteraeota bacterium]
MAAVVSRSPFTPSDVVAEAPAWEEPEITKGVRAARAAGESWRHQPAPTRAVAMRRAAEAVEAHAGELADLIIREVGKPRAEAPGEVARAVGILHYYAQQVLDPDGETYPSPDGSSLLYFRRRPRGVVTLITPWNFPIAIPIWKAAPALAFGNAVLLKPATEAMAIALKLEELFRPVFPEGLFQVAPGHGSAAQALLRASDAVSFTGSTETGRAVAAAAVDAGIPAQCEMGGQNASVVLPDADLQKAATQIAWSAFGYAGQKCTATSRVVVVGDTGRVVEALEAAPARLPVGDPAAEGTQVGPVIDEGARARMLEAAEEASRSGGTLVHGGKAAPGEGWMVEPTLITGLGPEAPLNQREVFAPFATVIAARDLDHAIEIVNGVEYGLVTSVYTKDLAAVLRLTDRIDTGMVRVNAPTAGVDFYAPFGGEKHSSYGPREQGKAAREFYTTTHTFTVSP